MPFSTAWMGVHFAVRYFREGFHGQKFVDGRFGSLEACERI